MVVVPPLCSILFGVESRGYYLSIHDFLHFTFPVIKRETDQRYFAFMFKEDHWEGLHLTHSSWLRWHCLQAFCGEAKK